MSNIDKKIAEFEAEVERLRNLKLQGVTDAAAALAEHVRAIQKHINEATALARTFNLDFTFHVDEHKDVNYSADDDGFYSNTDYGWSHSSMHC